MKGFASILQEFPFKICQTVEKMRSFLPAKITKNKVIFTILNFKNNLFQDSRTSTAVLYLCYTGCKTIIALLFVKDVGKRTFALAESISI